MNSALKRFKGERYVSIIAALVESAKDTDQPDLINIARPYVSYEDRELFEKMVVQNLEQKKEKGRYAIGKDLTEAGLKEMVDRIWTECRDGDALDKKAPRTVKGLFEDYVKMYLVTDDDRLNQFKKVVEGEVGEEGTRRGIPKDIDTIKNSGEIIAKICKETPLLQNFSYAALAYLDQQSAIDLGKHNITKNVKNFRGVLGKLTIFILGMENCYIEGLGYDVLACERLWSNLERARNINEVLVAMAIINKWRLEGDHNYKPSALDDHIKKEYKWTAEIYRGQSRRVDIKGKRSDSVASNVSNTSTLT